MTGWTTVPYAPSPRHTLSYTTRGNARNPVVVIAVRVWRLSFPFGGRQQIACNSDTILGAAGDIMRIVEAKACRATPEYGVPWALRVSKLPTQSSVMVGGWCGGTAANVLSMGVREPGAIPEWSFLRGLHNIWAPARQSLGFSLGWVRPVRDNSTDYAAVAQSHKADERVGCYGTLENSMESRPRVFPANSVADISTLSRCKKVVLDHPHYDNQRPATAFKDEWRHGQDCHGGWKGQAHKCHTCLLGITALWMAEQRNTLTSTRLLDFDEGLGGKEASARPAAPFIALLRVANTYTGGQGSDDQNHSHRPSNSTRRRRQQGTSNLAMLTRVSICHSLCAISNTTKHDAVGLDKYSSSPRATPHSAERVRRKKSINSHRKHKNIRRKKKTISNMRKEFVGGDCFRASRRQQERRINSKRRSTQARAGAKNGEYRGPFSIPAANLGRRLLMSRIIEMQRRLVSPPAKP